LTTTHRNHNDHHNPEEEDTMRDRPRGTSVTGLVYTTATTTAEDDSNQNDTIIQLARSWSSSSSKKKKKNRISTATATAIDDDDATTTMNHHPNVIVVTLFTKAQCTLCDQVKDVLQQVRSTHPHVLWQQDITDEAVTVESDNDEPELTDDGGWYDQYKYDIPVLHVNGLYWCKHRLTLEQAQEGLTLAQQGQFTQPRAGQPNAAQWERRRRGTGNR